MILLLTAEYSLKTNAEEINMATTTMLSFNPFANLREQIEYGSLANSCGFGQENGKSSFACILSSYISQQQEIERLRKENEELKAQRPKHTCPQDEDLTGGDANYEYYYTNTDDGEMTIWKVPRHLAEVKSATPNNWDNAVAECFRDEKFGENWDKLTYLVVREMKLKDLVKRKWKPEAEKPKEEAEEAQAEQAFFEGKEGGVIRWKPEQKVEQYTDCDECHRYCYTGGQSYPDGYVCNDCEPEENSDDDGADSTFDSDNE